MLKEEASLVSLRDVHYTYPNGVCALQGVSLEIREGELVGLLGENGSGKTTLARLLVGLVRPTKGTISVCGLDAATASSYDLARHVGLAFQNPDQQIFERTVWDEVAFGPRNYGLPPGELERRVGTWLHTFELADHRLRLPTSLSGGERKRVAFASTFALEPEILLLDEPTKGMDYGRKARLAGVARDLAESGRAVVIITHDVEFAYEVTERTIVLHHGKVLLDGGTLETLSNPHIEDAGLVPPVIARLSTHLTELGLPTPVGTVEEFCRYLEAL